jgi:hypothetical protein
MRLHFGFYPRNALFKLLQKFTASTGNLIDRYLLLLCPFKMREEFLTEVHLKLLAASFIGLLV